MNYFKNKYILSNGGCRNILKGIVYSVFANISLMLPVLLLAVVLKGIISRIVGEKTNSIDVLSSTIMGIIILIVIFVLHYIQYTCTYIGTYKESAKRRIYIAEHLRKLPLTFFSDKDIAEITGTIMGDCANFEHAFSHTVAQFFGAIISTGIICIILICVNPRMGIALLWVAPVAFGIVLLSRKLQDKLGEKHIEDKNNLTDSIQECLENIQDIKACNANEDYVNKLDILMNKAEKSKIKSELITASLITTGQMFLKLGLATIIVVGNNMVLKGQVDLYTYILFLIAASRIYDPLSGAMVNMSELFSLNIQIKRLKNILNYPLQKGEKKFEKEDYSIKFNHVKFSYGNNRDVLKDVSFEAKQGEVTAIVGPSGCGKSTLLKLAARFHDIDNGTIIIGGEDISELETTELMKNFSIVFQDVVLFNNTVMENIRVGRKDATDEEVIDAATRACCNEFIDKMPNGYNTMIGENGTTLSGGECQRISIARAILKDAPIICLDEATASLDVDSETKVQQAISRMIEGKTVPIIAHRMRTVEAANKIVVLKDGLVKEEGTHDELMQNNGFYRHMVELQNQTINWNL